MECNLLHIKNRIENNRFEFQRKRQRRDDSDSEGDTLREKLLEVETNLKDKEYEIAQLEKQVRERP